LEHIPAASCCAACGGISLIPPLAIVSDTHLGDISQQLTALRNFYRMAELAGAKMVLHCGDLIEGVGMRKSQTYHTFLQGADEIVDYVADNYPDNLPTWIIGGNHDESLKKHVGFDAVRAVSRMRSDIKYLGMHYAHFKYNNKNIAMFHGQGGANAYNRLEKSYSLACKKGPRPHLVLSGHLHYYTAIPYIDNAKSLALQVAGFQGMTSYLERKFLTPVIGGALVWFNADIPTYKPIVFKEAKNDFGKYRRKR
jgi:predicted phosphodiesterase